MTADPNRLLRQAEAHFVADRFAAARPLIEQVLRIVPGHPAVLHLHGLVLSRLGLLDEARRALAAAHRSAPADPQIANNLGNLLSKLGESEAALAAYEAAVMADPGFAPARLHRAMMLDELGRHDEARVELVPLTQSAAPGVDVLVALASVERNSGDLAAAKAWLDQALALEPSHMLARRGRARIAGDIGEPDAGERYRRILSADPADRELLIGYLAAADDPETRGDACGRIAAMLEADPSWRDGHRALSTALWEGGARTTHAASYETALAVRPGDGGLWRDYIAALGKVDASAAAAEICIRAQAATGDLAFAVAAFSYLSASGDVERAERISARLPAGAVPPVALAKHRLRERDAAAAEALLADATAHAPDDIEAWALRGIAWQLLGDGRHEWLNDQTGLVAVHDLRLSDPDIDAIVAGLRRAHVGSTVRAGQSVRGGTQTAGNLFDRADPVFGLLRDTLLAAIDRHRRALPAVDPTHPVLKHRDHPFAFAGSWSIRLTGGGFHARHIHPKGIVSAASYWALPVPSPDDPNAGWLEIGGAPDYLALDLAPLRLIPPEVGRLVLFPSTLHHGTRPFPAGERISVAFDVVAK